MVTAVRATWEYLWLVQMRDLTPLTWKTTSWTAGPGDTELVQHASDSSLLILQELGAQGWELVAGPQNFTAIVGIPARNSGGAIISVDGSDWYRREFWLKRPVTD